MYKKLSFVVLIVLALSLLTVGSVFAQGETPEDPAEAVEGQRGPRGTEGGRPERSTAMADALGMTPEELREALQSGQTMEELAAENGVDMQAILIEEMTGRLQAAVEEGRLTQEEADVKLAEMQEQIASGEMPGRGGPGMEGFDGERPERDNTVADALGMTPEEMREALQSGQTIEELAAEAGVDLPENMGSGEMPGRGGFGGRQGPPNDQGPQNQG